MSLLNFITEKKLVNWIVILVSLVAGTYAYFKMPRFEDPEFLIRTAQIITEYPGASPEEVADEVSDVIETEIQGMQEVEEIRSSNYYGYSVISVDIKQAFAPDRQTLQLVWSRMRDRVSNAARDLPPGAGDPVINDDYGDVFGIYYLVTGDGFTVKELEDYAEGLRTQILAVPGVAKVSTIGEQQEIITVEFSKDRVAALGVGLIDVYEALSRQNTVTTAGSVVLGDYRIQIHPTGSVNSLEAIRNVVIPIRGTGDLVRLDEIAQVERDVIDPAFRLVRFNGREAIAIGISSVSGSNVAEVGRGVRKVLDATLSERPTGMNVEEFYHQGDAVDSAVNNFMLNVVAAVLIVLVTLWIFMGLRSALVIGGVLVVSVTATLCVMYVIGIPMHRISLGALIIALGMLVDNAIVVVDGILVGVNAKQKVLTAARNVIGKTKWALLGGTAVGIIAFAPIGFAPGDTAEYSNHLFWVILISLSFSWIFALTLTPLLSELAFKGHAPKSARQEGEGFASRAYKGFLRQVVRWRWVSISVAVAMLGASVIGFQQVKIGFFPTSTTPQIAIDYWLPEGVDISVTSRDASLIEHKVAAMEGVESVQTIVGGGALRYMLIYTPEFPNSAYAQMIVTVDDIKNIDELILQVQSYLDTEFPTAQARVWRFQLGPSQGSKIEASFSGPDPKVLRELEAQAASIMRSNANAMGVKSDWRQKKPVFEPEYDAVRGGRIGISREALAQGLNTNYSGSVVGVFRDGDDLLPIVARAPRPEREDLDNASSIQVVSQTTGAAVPISETVTDNHIQWRDSQMLRENRVWTLKVQADPLPGVLASDLLSELRPAIEAIPLPAGYTLRWDGEFGDSEEANSQLAQTLPLGLLVMVLVVIVMFNALRQAAVIWLTVPLAIIGVVVGLRVTGMPMEFMGLLGLLSLSGLLIKNAIILVEQIDDEIRTGKPRFDAVIDSAQSRVRPVMMGTLTTVLGVLPLLADVFFASMAVVLAFGLIFATLLTLIILPTIYAALFSIKSTEIQFAAKEAV